MYIPVVRKNSEGLMAVFWGGNVHPWKLPAVIYNTVFVYVICTLQCKIKQ